ncbi:penicillin-binding protein activator, partial [Gammaproteobacteria bacterium]|nr:penicillin-binding protein activator [Gammaproteobacteria bacterium]
KALIEKIWNNMDGEVVSSVSSERKISSQKLLAEILLLEQSKVRSRKLSRIIGFQIKNEPRKREDIDSIFLSTSLPNARSLKPALEYNFADNISVYLIPSWGEDEHFTDSELDLEKVMISEMPFLLNTNTSFKETNSRNFAIGYDAYELVLLLETSSRRNFNYFGLTGLITNKYPSIQKKSLHAKVINGKLEYKYYSD